MNTRTVAEFKHCEFLGLEQLPSALYGGDKRKEMLDLLLGVCLLDARGK